MITSVRTLSNTKTPFLRSHISGAIKAKERDNVLVKQTPLLKGVVEAPPSKSYTQRAIMIGGLNGRVTIVNPLFSADSLASIEAWINLGAEFDINKGENRLSIKEKIGYQ